MDARFESDSHEVSICTRPLGSASVNPPDTETLVEAYFEHADWEAEQERAANTSKAVQTLTQEFLASRKIFDSKELTALYNLAQHQNSYGREKKREAVNKFDIASEAHETIHDCIDGRIGIVGSGTYTVDVDGDERVLTEFFSEFVRAGSSRGRYRVLQEFSDRDISGIQAGIISTFAYALFPEEYPIANSPAREGLADYFGHEVSDQLSNYPDTAKTFRTVREEYGFAEDFRHLDYFFQWAAANPTGDPGDPKVSDVTNERADVYWVNQSSEEELDGCFLYALDDDHYTHRLDRLTDGDLVFHNFKGKIQAISRATATVQATRTANAAHPIAAITTYQINKSDRLEPATTSLAYDASRPSTYYPVDTDGALHQGCLFDLSDAAAT